MPISGLPSIQGGPGGSAGPSRADQSSNSSQDIGAATGLGSGGGSRGFVNNVAFPGATLSSSAPIEGLSTSIFDDWKTWAAGAALLLIFLLVLRRPA